MTTPTNQHLHDFLLEAGFVHEHLEANWYETGSGESGPKVEGHPAADRYTLEEGDYCYAVYVDEGGKLYSDLEPSEAWLKANI